MCKKIIQLRSALSLLLFLAVPGMLKASDQGMMLIKSGLQKMQVHSIRVVNNTPYKLYWQPLAETVISGLTQYESVGGDGTQMRILDPKGREGVFTQSFPYTLSSMLAPEAIKAIVFQNVYCFDTQQNKISLGGLLKIAFDGTQKTGCEGLLTFVLGSNGQLTYEYSVMCP